MEGTPHSLLAQCLFRGGVKRRANRLTKHLLDPISPLRNAAPHHSAHGKAIANRLPQRDDIRDHALLRKGPELCSMASEAALHLVRHTHSTLGAHLLIDLLQVMLGEHNLHMQSQRSRYPHSQAQHHSACIPLEKHTKCDQQAQSAREEQAVSLSAIQMVTLHVRPC